jgi:hypothetical protein
MAKITDKSIKVIKIDKPKSKSRRFRSEFWKMKKLVKEDLKHKIEKSFEIIERIK